MSIGEGRLPSQTPILNAGVLWRVLAILVPWYGVVPPGRYRLLVHSATIVGAIVAAYYWVLLTMTPLNNPGDAWWYWHADASNLYPHPELGHENGFNYSPAFLFVVGPFRALPYAVFVAAWRALLIAALVWMAGPLTLPVLLTVPVASEINAGNIQLLLALAVVIGLRYPAAWAFVILTKVTPGVGLLWFVLRREWRALSQAIGVTVLIALASIALAPGQWVGWIQLLTSGAAPAGPPYPFTFWERLPFAIAVVTVGAWRGWRWTVVVASALALPVFFVISPSMLVGVLPFVRDRLRARAWAVVQAAPIAATAATAATAAIEATPGG